MSKKQLPTILLAILSFLIGAMLMKYFLYPTPVITPAATVSATPSLSPYKKEIVFESEVLLAIDNETIFEWFKTESQLCNVSNRTSSPEREKFCEDKDFFREQTRFATLVVSPDERNMGFSLESDTLAPDAVVGIFSIPYDRVHLLTGYYLGNEFIGFSPKGKYFAYQGECWEAMCGLFIKDAETLEEKLSVNNPKYVDLRSEDVEFVRWLSENEIEYKLGTELRREAF